jgi:hypothetical protein
MGPPTIPHEFRFPSKELLYLVYLAHQIVAGRFLDPESLSDGGETDNFLIAYG